VNFVVIYFLALIAGALVGAFYPTPRPYANTHEAVTDNIRALDTLYETHTERFVFLGIVSTLLTILAFFTSYAWSSSVAPRPMPPTLA
jgi:cobalamin biosynthesis protein CobD/CbiB